MIKRITHHASRITPYALPAIVLLGLAVRLWGLTGYGVWFDEAYHVQLVRLPTVCDTLDAVLYVALGIIAIYSHYVVAIILGLFALLSLARWTGPRQVSARAWLLAHVAIFAAWLPWLLPLLLYWLNADLPRATLRHDFEWS